MKITRYIVGIISFLFVWVGVAVILGIIMHLVFPTSGDRIGAGIGLDWRNLPGTILGILAGIQSFHRSIKDPKNKSDDQPA
ncbi:hypothetical protein ACXR0O_23450 [Verrucomicrobiota bacterium sgz303538]